MNNKSSLKIVLLTVLMVFFVIPDSYAQDAVSAGATASAERAKLLADEETRFFKTTEAAPEKPKDFTFNYGGWVFLDFENYTNSDHSREIEDWIKGDCFADTRVWLKTTHLQMVTFYGRMYNVSIDRTDVSSDYSGKGSYNEGPRINMLYASLNLASRFKFPLAVTLGRQYFTIGRGIVYSSTHDGIQMTYSIRKDVLMKAFASQTKDHEPNIDYSIPNYRSENNRKFYGAELAYITRDAVFYTFGLIQDDCTQKDPDTMTQNYTYDSQYIGLGVTGRVGKAFSYWGEIVKEYGSSYVDVSRAYIPAVKDVDAWAFDVGASYKLDIYSHPTFGAEIAHGSGDSERYRVTNTVGGNVSGRDTNFMYFGVFSAGYSFAPRISNMYIYKIEGSFKPVEFIPHIGKNIAMGSKYYIYAKDEPNGGIYDPYAVAPSRYVGGELDLFAHYKAYENLYFTVHCGIFFPGKAFPDRYKVNSEYVEFRVLFTI
ncbi:MAG: alginate export family protein [Candidatus Omnitrophica bacterium]|nr:alginate export family protein [Candidatus Omnitrophota bacterium]